MQKIDPYKVLGVARTATQKEIDTAYRSLAKTHHPDQNGSTRAAHAKMVEINAAHEALKTPEARTATDAELKQWEANEPAKRVEDWTAWAQKHAPKPTASETIGGVVGDLFDVWIETQPSSRQPWLRFVKAAGGMFGEVAMAELQHAASERRRREFLDLHARAQAATKGGR